MAFPTVSGGSPSQTSTAGTSHSVTFDTTPTTGDLLIIILVFRNTPGSATTLPANWNTLYDEQPGTSGNWVTIAYKTASGEGSSISVTTAANARMAAYAYRIAVGTFTGNPELSAVSLTANPPSLNPSWSVSTAKDSLWVAITGNNSTGSDPTDPANYTNGVFQSSGGSGAATCWVAAARRELNATSENPGAFSAGGHSWTLGVQGVTVTLPNKVVPVQFAVRRASFY